MTPKLSDFTSGWCGRLLGGSVPSVWRFYLLLKGMTMKTNKLAFGVAALTAAGSSFAAGGGIDTASITAKLTEAGTAAGVVGAAVLVVLVGIKAFKYIRSAM